VFRTRGVLPFQLLHKRYAQAGAAGRRLEGTGNANLPIGYMRNAGNCSFTTKAQPAPAEAAGGHGDKETADEPSPASGCALGRNQRRIERRGSFDRRYGV
jgi:hypothetical protein